MAIGSTNVSTIMLFTFCGCCIVPCWKNFCFPREEDDEEEEQEIAANKIAPESEVDSDVAAEAARVAEDARLEALGEGRAFEERDILRTLNMRKIYEPRGNAGSKIAVRDMSIGIPKGECFGLLGINGAGKTTCMKMLTGDVMPSSGSASILGYDVVSELASVRQNIGYCPQFDPLIEQLTGRETLRMYARLKSVPSELIEAQVARLLDKVGVYIHADKPCGTYSGGNKRKLSLAVALVGRPSVVFLDEPSTGMDPVARRQMWQVIEAVKETSSVVLTTHSMEECEALCNRIGIMVGGRFDASARLSISRTSLAGDIMSRSRHHRKRALLPYAASSSLSQRRPIFRRCTQGR